MNLNSSSTSSSEALAPRDAARAASAEEHDAQASVSEPRATWGGIARSLLWFALWMAVFDVAAGTVFRAPPPTVEPKRLQAYFEYGRSVEGKLRTMVTSDDATSAPIARAGWLGDTGKFEGPKAPSAPGKILVAAYGQSFTHNALEEVMKLDPRFEARVLGGPGAPLSHSVKLAELDRHAHQAPIVMVGVLASALPLLVTMTPITWAFEAPPPFTYPRYHVVDGQLQAIAPPFDDLAGLRRVLRDDAAFASFRAALAENDAGFNPLVFDQDVLDYSLLGRLVRRAVGHSHQTDFTARYHGARGFLDRDGLFETARALIKRHAQMAREDGRIPLVVLFEDSRYEGHLEEVFTETLRAEGIAFVSSRAAAPASNVRNFIGDGHFSAEANRRIAEDLIAELDRVLAAAPAKGD